MSFKYVEAAALNHENIGKHPERIKRIEPFMDQYKWT